MRTKLFLFLLLLFPVVVFAQDAATPEPATSLASDPLFPVYLVSALMFVVVLLVLAVAAYLTYVLNLMAEQAAKERAEKLGIAYQPHPTLWNRMWQSMNASVPVAEEKNIELDHNFDGIKELDNHLPPWWKWLLYGTVAWSVAYLIIYHVTNSSPLSEEEYRTEMTQADEAKRKFLAAQPQVQIDENALTYSADDAIIGKGKEIYMTNCAPCHKNQGEGGIGPNLTDDYWIHGGDVKNVYATIKNGVPEKGMVSWATVLSPEQIRNVSFFVMSIHGTNPPGAKAAQGELYKPKATEPAADSTKVQASL